MTKKASVFKTKPSNVKEKDTDLNKPIWVPKDNLWIAALFGQPENLSVSMGVDLHLLFMRQIGMFSSLQNIFLDEPLLLIIMNAYWC